LQLALPVFPSESVQDACPSLLKCLDKAADAHNGAIVGQMENDLKIVVA